MARGKTKPGKVQANGPQEAQGEPDESGQVVELRLDADTLQAVNDAMRLHNARQRLANIAYRMREEGLDGWADEVEAVKDEELYAKEGPSHRPSDGRRAEPA